MNSCFYYWFVFCLSAKKVGFRKTNASERRLLGKASVSSEQRLGDATPQINSSQHHSHSWQANCFFKLVINQKSWNFYVPQSEGIVSKLLCCTTLASCCGRNSTASKMLTCGCACECSRRRCECSRVNTDLISELSSTARRITRCR